MHDDMSSILRGYTEEAVSKSRKVPHNGKKKQNKVDMTKAVASSMTPGAATKVSAAEVPDNLGSNAFVFAADNPLTSFSDDQLMMEVARRKARQYRKSTAHGDSEDPTGQVCTLNGGNGSIPCRELME